MSRNTWWRSIVVTVALIGVAGMATVAQSALAQLGVKERDARDQALAAVTTGNMSPYLFSKGFKALPAGSRAQAVTAFASWTKAFVTSPAFKAEYEQWRQGQKPVPKVWTETVDQEVKRSNDETKKSLADSLASLDQLPPDTRKQVEPGMRASAKMVEDQMKDPQYQQILRQGIEQGRVAETADYQERLKRWQNDVPADPHSLVVRRLHTFLDESAGVDYDAKLVPMGALMQFANPEYERKSPNWKVCFRAGKEPVAAAREFATAWLAELEK